MNIGKACGLILMFFSGVLFSQSFKLGVTGNFHKSSIVGIHDFSKGKFGGGLGFYASFPLVENDIFDSAWLYLVPQIEYSMQGENADPPQGYQTFDNHYVAAQFYVKYFLHKDGFKRDVFFFAGPRVEYLVSEARKGPEVYDMFVEQEKKINSFGYGVSFGAGLRISNEIEAFLRYDRGFSKIYPDYTMHNTYNRLLGIGINYTLYTD